MDPFGFLNPSPMLIGTLPTFCPSRIGFLEFAMLVILGLEFSGLSAHVSGLHPLFSRFPGSQQIAIQVIFLDSDLDSAHRASMNASIFKPFGKTNGNLMRGGLPKPNFFSQPWWVQISSFSIISCGPFWWSDTSSSGVFFADTGMM